MLKNYFKIAWRNLLRHKLIGGINIAGLSFGFAFTLLISGYVLKELQVNQSLKNSENQYIIQSKWKEANMGPEITTLAPLAPELKRLYPDLIANYYRWDGITSSVSRDDKHYREEIQIGDTTFLSMFGFKLISGDVATAFHDPSSVVITSETAIKYFGSTDVIGKMLNIENFSGDKKDFIVTGVLNQMDYNSVTGLSGTDKANIYLPASAINFFHRQPLEDWGNFGIVTFIELQPGVTQNVLQKAAKTIIEKNTNAFITANMTPFFSPIKEYYLNTNNGLVKKMLYTLSSIALFILLMAIINFINISISKSTSRMREIGMRKVLGGLKKQLIVQFLSESVLLVFLSALCSLFIYQALRPVVSTILGKQLFNLNEFPLYYSLIFLLIIFLIGLIAGIFPAFVLSSFATVDSLKGKLNPLKENLFLRKILIGFQFSMANFVLIGMFVISKQVSLFFSSHLGYNKEYVLSVTTPRDWTNAGVEHMQTIRNELSTLPFISNASLSYAIPNGRTGGSTSLMRKEENSTLVTALAIEADSKYAETYGMSLLAGSFLKDNKDTNVIVINETALKSFGWSNADEAIGKSISNPEHTASYTILGVIKDFHFTSMKEQIKPIAFISFNLSPHYRFMSFKMKAGNISQNLEILHEKWAQLLNGAPFEYKFMDETLAELYKTEIQLERAAYISAALSVLIVLLGIIGLISISTQKRIKEIGIRKVLGSSPVAIVSLFLKEFLLIVFTSGLIVCPFAWYVFQNWLNDYSYRISLTSQPFILSILILSGITLLLISIQTLKAALTNPVKSLRING